MAKNDPRQLFCTRPLICGMMYPAWTTNDLATTRPLKGVVSYKTGRAGAMAYLKYTSAPPELFVERRNGRREVVVEFNTPTNLVERGFNRPACWLPRGGAQAKMNRRGLESAFVSGRELAACGNLLVRTMRYCQQIAAVLYTMDVGDRHEERIHRMGGPLRSDLLNSV